MIKLVVKNINIEEILLSGSCFRCIKEEDGSFTNILKDRVVNLKQDGDNIYIKSSNYDNLEEVIKEYFDLNRDYEKIRETLIQKNSSISKLVDKCSNYRILNQDSFEMGISYIISQSNNVKRISKAVERIATKFGKKVTFEGKEYFLFPTYEDIKNITIEDLSEFKLGYRDKYIINYLKKYELFKDLDKIDIELALSILQSVKGIGLKVASCILLFGYKRLDVFPIDTWVKKYMNETYNIKPNEKDIKDFAKKNFDPYTGLVIQYMFHTQRNKNNTFS